MGVGDLLGKIQAAADQGQPAVGADRAVEAGAGRPLLGEELPPRRPGGPRAAQRAGRVGKARQRAIEPLNAPTHVVLQQLARGRGRCRRPRRRYRPGRVGGQVQQRAECSHPRDPVGDGVMQLHEQAHPSLRQAGQQPHLPQRPCRVQPSPRQLLACQQQLCLVTRSGQREDPDVVGEVEGCRVDPQRPAQPPPRPVQALPETRNKVQSRLDPATDRFDPDVTVVVEQAGPVQDGQRTDVPGPAEVVPQENLEV